MGTYLLAPGVDCGDAPPEIPRRAIQQQRIRLYQSKANVGQSRVAGLLLEQLRPSQRLVRSVRRPRYSCHLNA